MLAAHERDAARAKLATLANGVSDAKEPSTDGLSDRDRRIREFHQAGVSNREIGRRLDISESTIRYRLSKMAQC